MVRTRIAPSPTGEDIHIGNLYTALINYAVAKRQKGKFIIRIEDTDRERYVEGCEERILLSLKAFGLFYDEGPDVGGPFAPYRQSERKPLYLRYAKELIKRGKAYYCFCTRERLKQKRHDQLEKKQLPRYDKYCLQHVNNPEERIANGKSYVIRLNVTPHKKIWFDDVVRGKIEFDSEQIDDQVLIKSDGFPTYHLGVVVDDHLMEISHVIRAEEWISSTPKHVLLYEAFAWTQPIFAHLPILRNPDRSKLSKRKNPVWASWYLREGFLPEAILNFLALLGWSHPQGKEIFSLSEFISLFDLKDINPVAPIFDIVKLRWMNQQYIQRLNLEELKSTLKSFYPFLSSVDDATLTALLPLVKTRMETLKDFVDLTDHFFNPPKTHIESEQENVLATDLAESLSRLSEWKKEAIFSAFKAIMQQHSVRMPMLYKLFTGKEKGLPLPESLEILGREQALARLAV